MDAPYLGDTYRQLPQAPPPQGQEDPRNALARARQAASQWPFFC